MAISALHNRACRKLFSKDVDPVKLLQALASGNSPLGSIRYGYFDAETNAQTSSRNLGNATIRINANPESKFMSGDPSWGNWGLSIAMNRAITMIHELGHAANDIYGTGSSRILNGDGQSQEASGRNAERVYNGCFRKFGPDPEFTH